MAGITLTGALCLLESYKIWCPGAPFYLPPKNKPAPLQTPDTRTPSRCALLELTLAAAQRLATDLADAADRLDGEAQATDA